jgi:signal transduction histidine kinase
MRAWFGRAGARLGRPQGVRARSTLVAVVVVGLALLAGGSGLVVLLQYNLERTAEDAARNRAAEVVALIEADGAKAAAGGLSEEARSGQFVQVVRADGSVVGASNRLVARRALSTERPNVGDFTATEPGDLGYLGEDGEWLVVATAVARAGSTYFVYVATSVRVQRETVQTVVLFLLVATPLLLAGVGLAVWRLVGRALGSVEQIRTQVAAIDAQRMTARVEVPPARDEVAALATTMNGMLDRMQVSQRAQRAFVSDASHELRSPLSTLTTAAELATQGDEPTRTRLLRTINLELVRMGGLVENLMTLARADADDLAVPPAEVDLDDFMGIEARRLATTSSREVQVIVEPARVWGDPQRLSQALRNLVDNAERHAVSTVRLSLSADTGQARLWVDNDGPVIAVEDRERIFERFVRLDESRSRDAGGSGLGLAIARVAVRSYGGEVEVVDAPDGWCRFELRMPLDARPSE